MSTSKSARCASRSPAHRQDGADLGARERPRRFRCSRASSTASCRPKTRKLSDQQVEWIDKATAAGVLEKRFNTGLFTNGASSNPETAGIGAALVGSLFMMLTVLVLAVPLGVAAAVYLEEFAPQEPLDRPHRGQHQQSRRRALDRVRPARASRSSSTSSGCRARLRWSAASCWR